jgi:hypothetical protein
MFLCRPATATVAGSIAGAAPPLTHRFLARLTKPVVAQNAPGSWWKKVQRLSLDSDQPLNFQSVPFTLDTGKTYDLRLLSRDRTAKHRGDVATLLESMGGPRGSFQVDWLMLRRRDMRVPRSTSSTSEWLAGATWTGPRSVITREEPFHFADLKESQP